MLFLFGNNSENQNKSCYRLKLNISLAMNAIQRCWAKSKRCCYPPQNLPIDLSYPVKWNHKGFVNHKWMVYNKMPHTNIQLKCPNRFGQVIWLNIRTVNGCSPLSDELLIIHFKLVVSKFSSRKLDLRNKLEHDCLTGLSFRWNSMEIYSWTFRNKHFCVRFEKHSEKKPYPFDCVISLTMGNRLNVMNCNFSDRSLPISGFINFECSHLLRNATA